ncbi:hypothetical protein [Arthrobacter sp. 18067]|uniref:hypothetical protein n=1 Tax=Arthrobacter sp. 18067 TaxID=2681413 RepID=UPI001357A5F7|nr:hypothetical protein [Arthrobacter sp. 18067]
MLNFEILRECAKSWPNRPTIDPRETLYTPDQLEAHIDVAMQQFADLASPEAVEWLRAGVAAFRGLADAAESLLPKPTKNQQLPAFRRPSWQRKA